MRAERQSDCSAQTAAAADRNFSAFWLITMQQDKKASNDINYSFINVGLNGIAFGMN